MNKKQKLISIITPVYNCEGFIHRLLDSVLQQTYNNIEMFVIDDGSTDKTKQVIEGYFEKFQKRGFAFQYIYQENQGIAATINNGLKLVQGDYLVYPDHDDFYAEPDSLEIMATALDTALDDISCCRALAYYIDEDTLNTVSKISPYKVEQNFLFEEHLFVKNNIAVAAILYMIKTKVLFNEIDNRNIYVEREAWQNWQILLPVLYNYKCISINKYLFKILKRSGSVSRTHITYEKLIQRYNTFQNVAVNTINNIKNMPERERDYLVYKSKNEYFSMKLFSLYFVLKRKKEAIKIYKQMHKSNISIPLKMKLRYIFCFIPFGFDIYDIAQKIRRQLRKKK